jgi:nitrite reductase/ring-hydroxylating ferredoxin subunit
MRMEFVRVAGTGDIAPGEIKPIEANGAKLLLAQVGTRYFAAQRKCPHLGLSLCRGSLDGNAIVCMFHGAKFDLETGAVERNPKLLFLKMTAKSDLPVYQVKVQGADILVGV